MPAVLNPYMNFISDTSEQGLVRSLTTEFIKMHSKVVYYLPRSMQKEDALYNEDVLSQFTQNYKIPVYLKDVQGWGGEGDFMRKFGIQTRDTLSIVISREKFADIFRETTIARPMEGDLVYVPAPMDALFEIKYVDHEKAPGQFYPLGALYYYEVRMELHVYNHENFATGNTAMDTAFEGQQAYIKTLTLGTGTGNFTVGETAFQGSNISDFTASGVVTAWNANNATLSVSFISGQYANNVSVIGANSGASYILDSVDNLDSPNDPNDDNVYLRDQAASIIDR